MATGNPLYKRKGCPLYSELYVGDSIIEYHAISLQVRTVFKLYWPMEGDKQISGKTVRSPLLWGSMLQPKKLEETIMSQKNREKTSCGSFIRGPGPLKSSLIVFPHVLGPLRCHILIRLSAVLFDQHFKVGPESGTSRFPSPQKTMTRTIIICHNPS